MESDPKSREAGIEAAFAMIADDPTGLKLETFLQTLPEGARSTVVSLISSARGTLRKQKELSDQIAGLHGDMRVLHDDLAIYKARDREAAMTLDDEDEKLFNGATPRVAAVHGYVQAMLGPFLAGRGRLQETDMNMLACAACALFDRVEDAVTDGYGWGSDDDLFVEVDGVAGIRDCAEIPMAVREAAYVEANTPPKRKPRKAKVKKKKSKR